MSARPWCRPRWRSSTTASRSSSGRVTPGPGQRRMAQDLGADAVMVAPAREPTPGDVRIVELYQRIADRISIPIVLQDHPASTEVHLSVPLIARVLRAVPTVACVKEEAVPTAPKVRQLRDAVAERQGPIPPRPRAPPPPVGLAAPAHRLHTRLALPEVLAALAPAARAGDWPRVHALYARFAALIVFEQQPGVAIRKELLRRRGLITSSRVRHPGNSISLAQSRALDGVLARTLPG